MLVELHMIQNHNPANLNRDDLGAPKTCLFGGVIRARISSQCLKRTIRRGADFQKALERDGGIRTRRLITELAERASGSSPAPDEAVKLVADAFDKGGVKRTGKGEEPDNTEVLLFIPRSTLDKMVNAVREAWRGKVKSAVLCEELATLLGEKVSVPDMALSGRMTELESKGLFRKIDFHVEAALSAAHAISTHAVINEVDYFTAADDLAKGSGAAHVNEAMFNSACFYKHFSIDWDKLVSNLGDDSDLASLTIRHFIQAAARETPTGKQHAFAAFNPPEGILVEIKAKRAVPISHANAFADPVPANAPRGLIGESIARLGQHVHDIAEGYGIEADRFWFSPAARHDLTYIDRTAKKEPDKVKPVIPGENCFPTLDQLVDRVIKVVEQHTKNKSRGIRS